MMVLLMWIGLLLGCGLAALLVVPVELSVRGFFHDQKGWDYAWRIAWGPGIISLKGAMGKLTGIYIFSFLVWRLRLGTMTWKKRDKKSLTPRKAKQEVFRWGAGNFNPIGKVLGRFIRALAPRGYLKGQIGLDDPEHAAAVHFMADIVRQRTERFAEKFTWALASRYDEEIVDLRVHLRIRLILIYLALIALHLLLKQEIRAMWRSFPKKTARI